MFKKGDKIICKMNTGAASELTLNKIYTVEEDQKIKHDVLITSDKGNTFYYFADRFELPSGGLKFDDGKPPISLVDPEMIEGVAAVMGFGAKKYAAHNWRKGLQVARCLSAALRHILAVVRGEDIDPESGLPHIDHAICSLQFARHMIKHRPDMDDRYKGEL